MNSKQNTFYYEGVRTDMLDFIPSQYSKVLEIGCGDGEFRKSLQNKCEYWGIEPFISAAKVAQTILDKVLVGTFEEVIEQLPNDYFDLIICNDVIEHMDNHHKFYELIQEKCKSNAYIVGSIPNVRFVMNLHELLIKKDWLYKEEGILDRTHLRFFTLKSMIRDFESYGFTIEKLYGINKLEISLNSISALKVKIFQLLLGDDTQYLQFGFRVKI